MCGIHGVISGPKGERNADDFLRDAFVANQLRGTDSAGLVVISHSSTTYDMCKLPVSGQYFAQSKAAMALIREASYANRISIGHVRSATVGGTNIDSAHPFECWNKDETNLLVGVHNGTLTNWTTKPGAKNYDVDSEWALNHIRDERADAFEDFTGAFCFVWWDDKDPDFLNFALNKERPMHVVMLKEGGMAYASEAGMLYWLLSRRDVKMDGDILELQPDYWYKFPIKSPKDYTKTSLPKAKTYTSTPITYKSVVDKVEDLLTKFKKEKAETSTATTTAAPVAALVPYTAPKKAAGVSQMEYEAAVAMQLAGTKVKFSPLMRCADGVEGIVVLDTGEYSGLCMGNYAFDADTLWETSIVGVNDNNPNDISIIVDSPFVLKQGSPSATTVH